MNEQIIQAAIVNHERTQVLVNENGQLPELEHIPGNGTYEDTLLVLGRTVLQNVAYVSPDHGYGLNGKFLYQTKPVPQDAVPIEPYQWGETPVTLK